MVDQGLFIPLGKDLREATNTVASSLGLTPEAYIVSLLIRDFESRKNSAIPLEERIAKQMVVYAKNKLLPFAGHILGFNRKSN
jgi:hypothetical protein